MATVKISALPEITSTATDDVIAIVDTSAGTTNKIQVSNLPSTGIASVAADTTPQLGGELDVVTYDIVSTANRDIDITPNGTGSVVLDGLKYPQADGTANYVLKTDGAAQLSWVAQTTDTDTTYSKATDSALGLVKLEDGTVQSVAANTVSTTGSRTYGVQLNSSDQAVVNVPWVDTDTDTNQLTTFTVSATTDTTATTISQGDDLMFTAGTGITCETTADGTVTISNTVTDTDTTYTTATASALGLVKIEDDTDQTVAANAVSATASRTYGVQLNSSDQAVVNVPWTDTDTNTDTKWDGGTTGLTAATGRTSLGLVIGTDVQAYDVDNAVTDADQSWTGSQRGTPSVVTDGTLDLNTANNFKYTPAASPDTLEFTNETAGQSGFITVINASGHTIATGSEVKKSSTWDVSTAGTYLVSYYSDGTNVYLSASAALAT
jgi:hypothetical protein